MRLLARLLLAFLLLCGHLPQSLSGIVASGCARPTAANSILAADSQSNSSAAAGRSCASSQHTSSQETNKQSSCEMPCCHEQNSTMKSCCTRQHQSDQVQSAQVSLRLSNPKVPSQIPVDDAHGSQPSQSSDDTNCPCCPGSCCLPASGLTFWFAPATDVVVVEAFSALVIQNDRLSSRSDPPALPPPRVMFAA